MYHELGSRWSTDDPCTELVCTTEGVKRTNKYCKTTTKPGQSCFKYIPAGECCPIWNCSCYGSDGHYHETGSRWTTGNPCEEYVCTTDGIQEAIRYCAKTPQPLPICFQDTPTGDCCPIWNCSGCIDSAGNYHPLYEQWETDHCNQLICTMSGIRTTPVTCTLGDPPHRTCVKHTPDGECCPIWKCRDCIDYHNNGHELGSVWQTDPCTTHTCTLDGISTEEETCTLSPPPPYKNCQLVKLPGQCCTSWSC
ncbi:von Willebrand factor C and EGF domain-containing protein-like [Homarus americanus]|uniref:von Willebrand factor C and EGF domain-containing protein-like n=1 Tax=Homarus americanus TaxID=6706 RepID=UPI001C45F7C8|nr:von Willebrand factor C and EGF domain-containing protein-like [Homarus americanus]